MTIVQSKYEIWHGHNIAWTDRHGDIYIYIYIPSILTSVTCNGMSFLSQPKEATEFLTNNIFIHNGKLFYIGLGSY